MRLINSFEFKQRVLWEINRRYPKDRDTAFANAVRCGVRIALRCMEQTTTVEAEPTHYGWWELRGEHPDGYDHHYCTHCNRPALFHYEYRPDYTEDYDGEWRYLCDVEDGICEFLTKRCPHCGTRMGGSTYE